MSRSSLSKLVNASNPERISKRADTLADYDKSLMSPKSLALLTEIIIEFQPRFVLEIGTYFGGGSQILAKALAETESGLLVTIDSNSERAEEVTRRIEEWDENVRERVTFMSNSSEQFFNSFDRVWQPTIDIAVVDGDHTYLGAYSDIVRSAQRISGGGLIIIDDFSQSTVNRAVADFIQTHPDWTLVGDIHDTFIGDQGFEPQASIEGTPFLILLAPDYKGISKHPTLFDYGSLGISELFGANIVLAPHECKGMLHGEFCIELVDETRSMVSGVTDTVTAEIKPETENVGLILGQALATEGRQLLRCLATYTWQGGEAFPHLPLLEEPTLVGTAA